MKRYGRLMDENHHLSPRAQAHFILWTWRYARLHPQQGALVEALRIATRPSW